MCFKRHAQSTLVSLLSLTLYLLAAESVEPQASDDITTRTRALCYVRRRALCVLVWEILWSPRGIRNKRKKWKKQCKLKKARPRDEKFCLAGFCAKKEQNKMKELLYFRYDRYTYVITARVTGTTYTRMSSQLYFKYDMYTCVITACISGTTYTLRYHFLYVRYDIHLWNHSL